MKTVKVRIEGISPLLMHKFSDEDLIKPKTKQKNLKKNQDDVESYLYKDSSNNIAQPSTHLIGALKKAGAKFQIAGQGKLTYKNLLGSGVVIIDPAMIPHENQNYEIDKRAVVIQRARIMRSRPCFPDWALNFEIEYDDDEITADTLKEILDYAGRRVGIGDFRPEKGGPFGRFHVIKWDVN